MLFAPTGDYEVGRIANLGKNRWALDTGVGFTLANLGGGRELSGVLGLTFNDRNDDTGYKSGIESHLELALVQHLPKNWSIGLVGYYYYQLASMKRPLSLNLRLYHEFDARNRVEGDSVFLTLSLPLTSNRAAGN